MDPPPSIISRTTIVNNRGKAINQETTHTFVKNTKRLLEVGLQCHLSNFIILQDNEKFKYKTLQGMYMNPQTRIKYFAIFIT